MINTKPKIRLYVPDILAGNGTVTLSKDQSHYVIRVMRQGVGDHAALFNGRDGEWEARIEDDSKSACRLSLLDRIRFQPQEPDIWLVFAPIKKSRLDFLVEKAVELGVSRLIPVLTDHTDVSRVNVERLSSTAMEAAEQCERLSVPVVEKPISLNKLLADWDADRLLFMMDETGNGQSVTEAFDRQRLVTHDGVGAILVGPEGGFSRVELDALRDLPFVTPVTLGPRVLRAETAALSALVCWQVLTGDACESRPR